MVGDAVVVDISAYGHNACIDLPGLQACAGDLLRAGDIAFFYTGFDRFYRTERQHDRPWFTTEAIGWLAEEFIAVTSFDGVTAIQASGLPPLPSPRIQGCPSHAS